MLDDPHPSPNGASGGPPMTAWRAVVALAYGLALICPVCHRGRMGRSFFQLRERCPVCGVVFERNPGEVTGGMAINMVLSSMVGIAAAVYLAFFSTVSPLWLVVALTGITLGFGLLFHRHARGLWVGFLYLSGAIRER
jgi:uncharacterized protein (DUF983 family)